MNNTLTSNLDRTAKVVQDHPPSVYRRIIVPITSTGRSVDHISNIMVEKHSSVNRLGPISANEYISNDVLIR